MTAVRVDVPRQTLEVLRDGAVVRSYPVSTSRFGLGTEPGSYKTPLGRFVVAEKIGHHAPLGAVFRSRVATGEISGQGGDEDLVLTRILWLSGVEEANANTRDRFIYVHGTNQELRIGTAASHGCVRMRNVDVAELFDQVADGTPVEITT